MLSHHSPDSLDLVFDDRPIVANAGLLVPITLARKLGLPGIVDRHLRLKAPSLSANAADKIMTLVTSALAGGDCIDDVDMVRTGLTDRILGFTAKAPSTVGSFMRAFKWGHARQLDLVTRKLLKRAWKMGLGPGDEPLTIDIDSTICETYGLAKEGGSRFTHKKVRGYHPLLATAAGTGDVLMARLRGGPSHTGRAAANFLAETFGRVRYAGATGPITVRGDSGFASRSVYNVCIKHGVSFSISMRLDSRVRRAVEEIPEEHWQSIKYWKDGFADVAETRYTPSGAKRDEAPMRLIVRRVRPLPGTQLAMFTNYSYHPIITNRSGPTLALEADHRQHADVENRIKALKYCVGLNHLPSGKFPANAVWLAAQVIAHNLARWTVRKALKRKEGWTTSTLRKRILSAPGRVTQSGRRAKLHMCRGWKWAPDMLRALSILRALPGYT